MPANVVPDENSLPSLQTAVLLYFQVAKKGSKMVGVVTGHQRADTWLSSKESTCQWRKLRFDPRFGKICWRRKWQPTPIFLPGKSHGQRTLVCYSSWGRKELDMTDQWCTHALLSFLLLPWLVLLYFICWFSLISPTTRPLECSTAHCFFSSYLPSWTWQSNPVSTLWWQLDADDFQIYISSQAILVP